MDKSTELLVKLMETIRCVNCDMGGNDRYHFTHKVHPVITKIKIHLSDVLQQSNKPGRAIEIAKGEFCVQCKSWRCQFDDHKKY